MTAISSAEPTRRDFPYIATAGVVDAATILVPPIGQANPDASAGAQPHLGDFDGKSRPRHGSRYDSSGRIRQGPAPLDLALPPDQFISAAKIRIGETSQA